ncbi:MAG: hypothetical protein ACQEXQ_13640 [Bacillota bacterium]
MNVYALPVFKNVLGPTSFGCKNRIETNPTSRLGVSGHGIRYFSVFPHFEVLADMESVICRKTVILSGFKGV